MKVKKNICSMIIFENINGGWYEQNIIELPQNQ